MTHSQLVSCVQLSSCLSLWRIRCANVSGLLYIGTNKGRTKCNKNESINQQGKQLHFSRRCQLEHKHNYAGNWAVPSIFVLGASVYVCVWLNFGSEIELWCCCFTASMRNAAQNARIWAFPISNISGKFWFSSDCFESTHTHTRSSHVYFMINSIFPVPVPWAKLFFIAIDSPCLLPNTHTPQTWYIHTEHNSFKSFSDSIFQAWLRSHE